MVREKDLDFFKTIYPRKSYDFNYVYKKVRIIEKKIIWKKKADAIKADTSARKIPQSLSTKNTIKGTPNKQTRAKANMNPPTTFNSPEQRV